MMLEKMLVKKAKAGDEQAFSAIVKLYEKQVYNSALYISKNHEDALDISQEVFIKLWRTLPSFRGEASLKTWIAKITRTSAIDYVKARNLRTTSPLVYENDDGKDIDIIDSDVSSDPVRSYERKESILALRSAIDSLPEPIKETLILRELHDLPYADIANALGISEGTVKSRISRGREQIKLFLKNGNFL
jgi:RNA polymerase sigma-70 factor (ECF subfamily)